MNNTIKELKELPKEIQEKAAHLVGGGFGATEITVEYEDGRYDVSTCICIRKHYSDDHKVWFFDKETIKQDEELNKIIEEEDKEYNRWLKNEGRDFDWEAFMQ